MTRVLVIGAHPDDTEFGAGGLLQRFSERRILIATHGERGGDPGARAHEAQLAAEVLGASLTLFGLEDTRVHAADLIPLLEAEFATFRPDVVCVPAEHDVHQDHRAVHHAGLVAARDHVCTLLGYMTPSSAERFRPTWYEPLTEDQMQVKLQALRCHSSQRERPYMTGTYLTSAARYWAMVTRSTAPYVEAFECIRMRRA